MERFIAVDNVCAWPNLTLMADNSIIASIFNQPCHGMWEGDVECWASRDGGKTWKLAGVPAPHEKGTNRMNVAGGLARDGSLILLASGWSHRNPAGQMPPIDGARPLLPWTCRSKDGGKTWEITEKISPPEGEEIIIPFGDIVFCADGTLGVTGYTWNEKAVPEERCDAVFYKSRDDGKSWGEPSVIGKGDFNETDLLCLKDGALLAVCRTSVDAHLELFISKDSGTTWKDKGAVTLAYQHPAHLCLLSDGRILLTYGLRNHNLWGVGARISSDDGGKWDAPFVLVNLENSCDCGYPSSVQLSDGTIVTAYYCSQIKQHQRYHMGVVRWKTDEIDKL